MCTSIIKVGTIQGTRNILAISKLRVLIHIGSPEIAFLSWYSTPDQRTIEFASPGLKNRRELLQVHHGLFYDNELISSKQSIEHFIDSFCVEQTPFAVLTLSSFLSRHRHSLFSVDAILSHVNAIPMYRRRCAHNLYTISRWPNACYRPRP